MNFDFNEVTQLTKVTLEKEKDICAKCSIMKDCPLLLAIIQNIVYPSANELEFTNCFHFKRKRTKKTKET